MDKRTRQSKAVMALLVQKFGGTSVADIARIEQAATKVAAEIAAGHHVVVVVSAMSGVTDQLIGYCNAIANDHDDSEHDAVVASGEQITSGLFAIALHKHGIKARSFMGWQVPLRTNDVHVKARIQEIDVAALKESISLGHVPVIAGFQGITANHRIATLGRGGSDTSAVALAAALGADRCDIYTDVDGVYTTDPRIVARARKLLRVSYEEMLEMASLGAKVLQTRSVELAMKYRVPVQVLSTFDKAHGSECPGTLVMEEAFSMENRVVSGIAYSRDEAKVTLLRVADKPGVAAAIFGPLAEAAINVDMIVQNVSENGITTDITFTVGKNDLNRTTQILESCRSDLAFQSIMTDANVAKVSVIGLGMRSHAGVAQKMFQALAEKSINIKLISTSEIKISVLLAEEYTELAVRALHGAYDLDLPAGQTTA